MAIMDVISMVASVVSFCLLLVIRQSIEDWKAEDDARWAQLQAETDALARYRALMEMIAIENPERRLYVLCESEQWLASATPEAGRRIRGAGSSPREAMEALVDEWLRVKGGEVGDA